MTTTEIQAFELGQAHIVCVEIQHVCEGSTLFISLDEFSVDYFCHV